MCAQTEHIEVIQERNQSLVILKAFVAIFFVMAFSGGPTWLTAVCQIFSIPALLMCMGYCFKNTYLINEKYYVKQKIKNIYCPFWGWSVIFLVLHNFFAWIGFVPTNSSYGWHEFAQRLWSITFNMSGYDENLCYAFWVFRTLFLSSLAFLVLYKVIEKLSGWTNTSKITGSVLLLTLGLTLWSLWGDLNVTGVANGGRTEILGTFFLGTGVLYRQYESFIKHKLLAGIISLTVWGGFVYWLPTAIHSTTPMGQQLVYVLPAIAAFILIHLLCQSIEKKSKILTKGLVYIGNRIFIILAFYLLAFKVISMFEVLIEDLPWSYISQYPISLSTSTTGLYFIFYVCLGVGLPLTSIVLWKWLDKKYNLTWFNCIKYTIIGILLALRYVGRFIAYLGKSIWKNIVGFGKDMKGFLNASNPKDE